MTAPKTESGGGLQLNMTHIVIALVALMGGGLGGTTMGNGTAVEIRALRVELGGKIDRLGSKIEDHGRRIGELERRVLTVELASPKPPR